MCMPLFMYYASLRFSSVKMEFLFLVSSSLFSTLLLSSPLFLLFSSFLSSSLFSSSLFSSLVPFSWKSPILACSLHFFSPLFSSQLFSSSLLYFSSLLSSIVLSNLVLFSFPLFSNPPLLFPLLLTSSYILLSFTLYFSCLIAFFTNHSNCEIFAEQLKDYVISCQRLDQRPLWSDSFSLACDHRS